MGRLRWEPFSRPAPLGIGLEGKSLPAVRAAEGAVNGRRPGGVVLDAIEIGVGGEFDDPAVVHQDAQAADETGHFACGGEMAFLG